MIARRFVFFFALCLSVLPLYSQSNVSRGSRNIVPPAHKGPVTSVFISGNEVVSAGEDGFIEIWDISGLIARERFQLSSLEIKSMVKRPGKDELCLLESDGLGLYRISAWNYRERKKIFSLRFRDPVTYINYSAGGNFIIAARTGRNGLVFIDSQSGDLLQSPETLSASVAFAATGLSERVMIAYFPSGELSYWNLETGTRTSRFDVLPNLDSVVMFGNGYYFAGVDSSGLAVLDAVSGALLDRLEYISPDARLCASGDELFCMIPDGYSPGIYRFAIDYDGRLTERAFFPLDENEAASVFSADNGVVVTGTTEGKLILPGRNGGYRRFINGNSQTPVISAAVSGSALAFLTEDRALGFLPLNYSAIADGAVLPLEKYEAYSRISALTGDGSTAADSGGQFILWQSDGTEAFPLTVSSHVDFPPPRFNEIPLRFPLRSVQAAYGKLLLLDSAGNVTALYPEGEKNPSYSFSAAGSTDATFIDKDNILLCRAAILGNTPFLMLNIATGETVPMARAAGQGGIYTAVIEETSDGENRAGREIKTSIIKLNITSPAQSLRLVEFPGEDTQFSMASAGNLLAATIGGEGAALFASGRIRPFERTSGLPVYLSSGGGFFIAVDTEGNVSWHNARTGRLEAVFTLIGNAWLLQTESGIRRGTAIVNTP